MTTVTNSDPSHLKSSPTYNLAKQLCAILTLYVPATYRLNFATDILDILKANSANGIMASLDAEKLFTHIPIDRTINYIIDRVYHNDSTPNIAIPESTLRGMLMCCTKEVPFICPRGEKYQQVGVTMGSPLGVLFANFYMGCIEKEVFNKIENLKIYCRYIDDIFIETTCIADIEVLKVLKDCLQDTSGLTFTAENSTEGSMPFLDILVKQKQDHFTTSVHVKPTSPEHCLYGKSEYPQRFEDSTISAYICRALTHCSTWEQVHIEIKGLH
ncbi:uncharacterized protein LOC143032180 [Oratosquilla oratoria]|uniref:uncharacterized protein LOC143032180 n=1 Tax=Oratosquilla oratoria TaxID=337810 RepID=UPI003F776D97